MRTRFFQVVEVRGVKEIDFLHHYLSLFKPRYATSRYRVDESEQARPDLISYKIYGTVKFWWIILVFNKIQNPLEELTVGRILEIPNILDIYDFYKRYQK